MVADSRLALGAVQWGMDYGIANRTGRPDEGAVREMLQLARAHGIDTIDTARAYGESEEVIGRLVGEDAHWTIVTKLAPDIWSFKMSHEESVRRVEASLAESRKALGRERLDAVLFHRPEHRAAHAGALRQILVREEREGRIGTWGTSVLTREDVESAGADPGVMHVQGAANFLDVQFSSDVALNAVRDFGGVVHGRSAFLQGVAFLEPDALPKHLRPVRPHLEALRELGQELGCSPAALWLSWAVHQQRLDRVVIGCERPEQLAENLAALERADELIEPLRQLRKRLPELSRAVLDPWRWPKPKPQTP